MNKITFDLSNALHSTLGNGNGITEKELSKFNELFKGVLRKVNEQRVWAELPFMDLPCAGTGEIEEVAQKALQEGFENFILLGIGGSSLGGRALKEALVHPEWNLLTKKKRDGYP